MTTIKQQTTSELALQKAEDNKKEIINIYSVLKNNTSTLQTQINSNSTAIEELKNNSDNSSGFIPRRYKINIPYDRINFELTSINQMPNYSRPLCIVSDSQQVIDLTISFTLYTYSTFSGTHNIQTAIYINNKNVQEETIVKTYSGESNHTISTTFKLEKGSNLFQLVFLTKTYNDTLRLINFNIELIGINLRFTNENGNNFALINADDSLYSVAPHSTTSKGHIHYKQMDINADAELPISDYSSMSYYSFDQQMYAHRVYNAETGTFDFNDLAVLSMSPTGSLRLNFALSSTQKSIYYLQNSAIVFCPTYSETASYQYLIYSKTNSRVMLYFGSTANNVSSQFSFDKDIASYSSVRIIDNLFITTRKLAFIFSYTDGTSDFFYVTTDNVIKKISLGIVANAQLYFYKQGIILTYNKNNNSYIDYYNFNSTTEEYVLEKTCETEFCTNMIVVSPTIIYEKFNNKLFKTDITLQ